MIWAARHMPNTTVSSQPTMPGNTITVTSFSAGQPDDGGDHGPLRAV
jgi:hypothetical protein